MVRPQPHVSPTRIGCRALRVRTASHAAVVVSPSPAATRIGEMRANPPGVDSDSPEPTPVAGTGRPAGPATTAASAGNSTTAARPKPAHATARITMPIRIDHGASCACAAAGDRGIARKVIPKAFTKPAAASPPVRASAPTARVSSGDTSITGLPIPDSRDWKRSHSLTKPFRGGSPAIERAPIRKSTAVHGSRRIRPPNRFMSRVPVAWRIDPAPRKSNPLNAAWLRAW